MKAILFPITVLAFAMGVAIRSFFDVSASITAFFALAGVVSAILFFVSERKWRVLIWTGIFLLAMSAGILRYEIKDGAKAFNMLERNVGKEVVLRGFVSDEPDERADKTRLTFISEEGVKILLYANRYPEFRYGDRLEIKGKLKKPENFSDSFDWEGYLAKDEIFFLMYYPDIKKTGEGAGSKIKQALFLFKKNFIDGLSRALPDPHASFMAGLTVGAKRSMPEELLNDFRKTGVIHIVVLSGYNVTIVAENIARFLKLFFSGIASMVAGTISIILFAIMTGASATTVRASIMAILILIARQTGKVYEVTMALLIAALAMLAHNPAILRFDPSFQLSFLATLGLIFIAPRIENYFWFLPKWWGIRGHAAATASAQLAVTPLLLNMTGATSLVALPANILILMLIPATMLLGFLVWIAGAIHYFLTLPFSWASWILLEYELSVVELFARLPFAEWNIPHYSARMATGLYAVLGLVVLYSHFRRADPVPEKISQDDFETFSREFEIEEIK